MAPMAPLGKARALALLRQGKVPMMIGSPHPFIGILEQDGIFRVRQLVVDPADAKADSEAAKEAGRPWMPENYYALGKPTGRIYLEAPTLDALIQALEDYAWPEDW